MHEPRTAYAFLLLFRSSSSRYPVCPRVDAILLRACASAQVGFLLCVFVLTNEIHDDLSCCVEFAKSISEWLLILVGFEESVAFS